MLQRVCRNGPRLTDVTLQVAGTSDGMTKVIREGGSDPGARLCLLDGPACLGSVLTTFTVSAGARGAWGSGHPVTAATPKPAIG
ncbi:MAG: hypothetical protein OXI81_04775 [Paracoccaceae bacterium]|nr:hypothetical protein [Paracoccaceae bacterium]